MGKVCVFCGKKPMEKTGEHIIPQWLIKLTGNPKRFGFFGFYKENNGLKEMHLVFDQFKFPACEKCNKEYLEKGVCLVRADRENEQTKIYGDINVVKEEAFKRIFNTDIPKSRKCFVETAAWDKLFGDRNEN